MLQNRVQPVKLLAILTLFLILTFLAVVASGFQGVLPGSMLFNNKLDNGYYVFYRLLEELGHDVQFEKRYKIPGDDNSAIIYVTAPEDGFDRESYLSWLAKGNTLVLIGNSISLILDEEAVQTGDSLVLRNIYNIQPYKEPLSVTAWFDDEVMEKLDRYKVFFKTSKGAVVVESRVGSGRILYIADISLFNNRNMHHLQNALLLENLFSDMKGQTLNMRERNPEALYDVSLIKGLLQGKGGYISFQLAIIFALSVMILGKRFARPEKLEGKKRRKVTEHTRAVGLFFQKANACEIVERVDSHYFRTIVCCNKKPSDISEQDYSDYGSELKDISEEEIYRRFKKRRELKTFLDKRRKYES